MWFYSIHQQESAISTPMSPPFQNSLPPPTLQTVTEPLFEFPESYSLIPIGYDFTYGIGKIVFNGHMRTQNLGKQQKAYKY